MAKRGLSVGPWMRGLNVRADQQLIRDDELTSALNVVIRSDGAVTNRPGFQAIPPATVGTTLRAAGGADLGERLDVLAIVNDTTFLVGRASWNTGTSKWNTNKIYKGVLAADTSSQTITWSDTGYVMPGTNPYIVKAIPYINDVFFIPNYDSTTMYYAAGQAITLNFATLSSVVIPQGLLFKPGGQSAVGNCPTADLAFVWKDRLFICYKDRIYYSAATNFTVWSTSPGLGGYFDVGADATNDLNYITSIVLSGDSLHIFKSQGTFGFTFQTDPGTDGYLRLVSDNQGAHSAVEWRNRIFTTDQKSVYEYVSGQFIDIANKLDIINNNSGYSTADGAGQVINSLHVVSDFLVLGPLIATQTPATSSRYYAMNLNNGAWMKWDCYGGKFHIKDAGDTDTVVAQGFSGTLVGPQHGYYYLGTSELGTQLVFLNFNENSARVADGLPTARRLPRYYFETKQFSFNNNVQFKKVYRVQFDRSLGISDGGISTTFAKGGFGVRYVNPADLQVSSITATKIQSLLSDHFGNLRAGSTFRCLAFAMFYEYYYVNQQSITIDDTIRSYRFKINGVLVYVDMKADFSNVQTLAVT
jgi:hypothetical protein